MRPESRIGTTRGARSAAPRMLPATLETLSIFPIASEHADNTKVKRNSYSHNEKQLNINKVELIHSRDQVATLGRLEKELSNLISVS